MDLLSTQLYKNTKDGVKITVYGFKPSNEQWGKFLTFVRQKKAGGNLREIFVSALHAEHGTLYNISYTVSVSEDYLVPDTEIDAIKPEDSP